MKGRGPAYEREGNCKKGGVSMQHNTRPIMATLANSPDPHQSCGITPDIVFSPSMSNVYINTNRDLLHVDHDAQKVRTQDTEVFVIEVGPNYDAKFLLWSLFFPVLRLRT
jgi:hypothetical protein